MWLGLRVEGLLTRHVSTLYVPLLSLFSLSIRPPYFPLD